jgi:hypothetical protein
MEVSEYPGLAGDADALSAALSVSVLRSLRRRYQTKVSVATFVSVSAIAEVDQAVLAVDWRDPMPGAQYPNTIVQLFLALVFDVIGSLFRGWTGFSARNPFLKMSFIPCMQRTTSSRYSPFAAAYRRQEVLKTPTNAIDPRGTNRMDERLDTWP